MSDLVCQFCNKETDELYPCLDRMICIHCLMDVFYQNLYQTHIEEDKENDYKSDHGDH